ncbi:MAG: ArsR family transcriptional regulator [Candidatus Bathyarchaeota archaeon]|nr:ArsR family transcriptional regulator [Candidatus Bathyarchaeota archaeon]
MSLPPRARGVKVLKAVSSPIRLQILNLLFDRGALSYTELMNTLKMNPARDAGRFAYHLKFLLKATLVEVDVETKKYFLTDLGKLVIDVADRVEKRAVKPKGMLVRTSHLTFEEFDANKISNSLIREAKMPVDLAQKISKEAEKVILKSKTKYLTAPLIREIVNVLLIEKGFEDYRHKLTRLGLPVHEVTALIETKDRQHTEADELLLKVGKSVLREYVLLNAFPRDIADAHLAGALHVDNVGTWILKPDEVVHDLRFFLKNGLRLDNYNVLYYSEQPPENFQAALSMIFNILLLCRPEVNKTQTIDHFNVFLAPYVKCLEPEKVKESLRLFVFNLNRHVDVSLVLDLSIPSMLAEKNVVVAKGNPAGQYGDFFSESQLLVNLLFDIFLEENQLKPLVNPKLIFKINPEALKDEKTHSMLLKAHEIAAEKGAIYFVNTMQKQKDRTEAAFSANGVKLEADLTGDWETDTLRTGCLGCVEVNLPRIFQESEKDKIKFFSLLKERCELAERALIIKQRALKQHGKIALPFMMQETNGDVYFRLENCTGIINLVGLKETVECFTSKSLGEKESLRFVEDIVQTSLTFINKTGQKHGRRVFISILPNPEASLRFARLDIEKYGVAKTKFSGTRDKPFYSATHRLQLQTGNFLSVPLEQLEIEQSLRGLRQGGNLTIIEVGGVEVKAADLLKLTCQLMENQNIEFLTYNRQITYCTVCQKSWFEELHKCPSCGSISPVVTFDRFKFT